LITKMRPGTVAAGLALSPAAGYAALARGHSHAATAAVAGEALLVGWLFSRVFAVRSYRRREKRLYLTCAPRLWSVRRHLGRLDGCLCRLRVEARKARVSLAHTLRTRPTVAPYPPQPEVGCERVRRVRSLATLSLGQPPRTSTGPPKSETGPPQQQEPETPSPTEQTGQQRGQRGLTREA